MMAKKQKFFKNLLASSAIASVVASLSSSNVAFAVANDGAMMIRNATLMDNIGNANWHDIGRNGVDQMTDIAAPQDNKAMTYGGNFKLNANRLDAVITAINIADHKPGDLTVSQNLSIGSIVRNVGAAGTLPIKIEAGHTLTLTGTPAAAANHGFKAYPNTYTGLGNVELGDAGSTLVVHSGGGDIAVGSVSAGVNQQGVLTFETGGSVGAIGANDHKLLTVNIGHAGGAATVTLNGDVYADSINLTNNNSILNVGDARTINGNILNTTGRNNRGTLTFLGAGTVIGNIGTDGARLAQINAKWGNVILKGDVFTNELALDANHIVQIGGNFTGVVDFNGGGVLTFNGADRVGPHGNIIPYTFNSAIQNGDNGTLRVFTNLIATNADIGSIKTIRIGDVLRGAKTLTIDAALGDVNLLGAANQTINFDHVDSKLILQNTANDNKTITFKANLDPDPLAPAASTKGIIEIQSVIVAKTLTIDGAALSLGTANHKLKKVIFSGDGNIDIVPTINAQNIELNVAELTSGGVVNGNILFNKATVFNANNNITGNVHFKGYDGTIKLADGKTIDGSITTQGAGEGILTFEGAGEVTEDIGAINANPALNRLISQININGAGKDVILRKNVYTDTLHFGGANTVKIGGDFVGEVNFNAGGTLEFNGADGVDPHGNPVKIARIFNLTIQGGANGILNVNTSMLVANNVEIGEIDTINIGMVGGDAKALAINASDANVNLLDGTNINFMHANSALALFTRGHDSTVTFHANLSGGVPDGHGGFLPADGGIVWLDGDDTTPGYTLTVQSATGAETLGTVANKLGELRISRRVTIAGDNTPAVHNKLDVKNANALNIINGATFTDKSTTSAKIANIHIGAASADVPTPAGPANYILDAEHIDFDLNAHADNQITFDHTDAQLTLKNSDAADKTITLVNNLNPGADGKGIVELHSVVAGRTLTIAGVGLSLGTAVNKLQKVIFSGDGKFNTQQITINSKNIELNVNELTLGDVNSNILFIKNTVLTVGDITGNVDFQNHDGKVKLKAGNTITGSITSTGGVNGTLEFLGIGVVTSPITKLKMLRAGVGDVRLVGGNYNITEIQGKGVGNLTFANNFNLTGSINSTGGNAVGLIFEGNNNVTGVVGTATSPVGSIQVQGTTVFGDKVQTANDQDIIISKGATAKFANSVTTRNIKGYAADQGTVQFSNAETIIVNSAIGATNAVDTLDIAGADVKITQAVSANYINFSNANKEATLTLEGTSTVGGIRTNGNNVHILALAADFTTGIQDIGLENNRLKSIKLLGDHKITINSGLYSDISTKTNNTGKVVFNSDRSFAYNLGTNDLKLSDVTFDKNATVRGDVYSKQITIASDKTATFAGAINRTISVPNFTVDGASISRSLKSFAYSTQIGSDEIKNEGIAKFDKAVLVDAKITGGKVTFTDNVWFKQTANGKEVNFAADKFVILEQNINFANIKADQAKIIILPKTASITGNLAAKGLTVDLAANQLKYTGQAQLTGKVELVTAYDTSSGAGGNIEVQTGSKLDLSKADELIIKVKAQTDINKILKGGAQYVVISSVNGNGLVAIDNSEIKLDPTGEQNRFVQWSMDSSDLKLYITDISKEVIAKEIADKSLSQEEREFYIQLNNVTDRNSSAGKFRNNIGLMDREHALQAMDRILPGNENPIGESLARNPTSEIIRGLMAQADTQITATRMGNSVPMQNAASAIGSGDDDTLRYGVWGSPFYGTACQETYKGVSGYKAKSAGGIVGFDGLVNDNLLLGAAYSRINTQMSHQDKKFGDKTNGKTNIFSLYSLYNLTNNWFTEAIASYGITRVRNSEGCLIATNVKRNVTALETAAAKYKSISYSGQLLTGYNYIASEKLMITPTIGFRYSKFKDAGYTETGTKFQNLVVKKRSYNKFEGILGLRTAATLKANKVLLIPELHGYVNHDFKGKAPIIDARLDGINEPLPTKSVKPVKTFFTVGTGFTAKYNMMECGIIYNVNIASKYIGHQGSLKVKVNF
ncbi:autotransporter domain-containing protein [Candidatus Tisiphia endosymbiont of Empis tessellata]|uniref:autotransporter domain-containing protein n=1 Tax=Candidatus Tisiphia endosymbiont of Empis tessellata TaxID=3066259 RepID=UPI00313B9B6F